MCPKSSLEEQSIQNLELGILLQRSGVFRICGLVVANSDVLLLGLIRACHLPTVQVAVGWLRLETAHLRTGASSIGKPIVRVPKLDDGIIAPSPSRGRTFHLNGLNMESDRRFLSRSQHKQQSQQTWHHAHKFLYTPQSAF
ncbi:uncharacterized protein CLUP02_08740 [Colletotrichum lupini]|uniref:Uncharacterized protein n=1 Tax=Colletotrichum lupini TaxID=145971 RepID=A0A9Q8SUV6_9PEZI|nr:uncharacterized protein CLUP02_08740 [Colletotrichum lupini]UQC83246.1 hypothetical protein CLUP02_08740 [Colletotrichum lupini]